VTFLMERSISRHKAAFSIGLLAICSAGAAWAQQSRAGSPSGDPNTDFLIATAREWGGKQGYVFTCDEWKEYLKRMYNLADRRHRGFIDAQDFEIIKRASLVFAKADFDYFDVTGKGRVTQKEFIATPSQFLQSSIRKTPAVSRRTTFGKRRHRQRRRQRLAMGEAGAALFCVSYCNYSRTSARL
jgi:hypothetical protein